MPVRHVWLFGALCLLCGVRLSSQQSLRPAGIFSDHMVLQRGGPVAVWGRAAPGASVRAEIAGRSAEGPCDAQGRWRVELPELPVGGPYRLVLEARPTDPAAAAEVVTLGDILVGEVWLCSGQSNMEWPVRRAKDAPAEIAAADHPRIRLFKVRKVVSKAPLEDTTGGWSRREWRWVRCSPDTVGEFSAVGYFFGRELQAALDVPVGLIQAAWGGTPAEAWTSRETLEAHPEFAPILERWRRVDLAFARWREAADAARKAGKKPPRPPRRPNHPHRAGGLYHGMIAPLVGFSIRGVIWYQGESNAPRARQYLDLFPALIRDWRRSFGREDLPFLFVQLANFRVRGRPETWAELREAQRRALSLPGTGMAVTIDIGDPDDIHPRNKQEVGRRLALLARARVYGEDVVCAGPSFLKAERAGRTLRLVFDQVVRTADGGPPRGFEIAGSDGRFVPARARLDGRAVVLEADAVAEPVAARYAWTDSPSCNLVNAAGLPASPFRTDGDWKWVTAGKR